MHAAVFRRKHPDAQKSWDVQKVHALVIWKSKVLNMDGLGPLFEVLMWYCVAGAVDSAPCQKWHKREGFAVIAKTMAGMGTWRCMSRGRRSTRGISIRKVRRPGCWFPQRCSILEHQIFRFAKTILPDRCSTSYDLASLCPGRRSTLDRWSDKFQNALVRGRQLCTQLSIFEGSLTELLRFWRCQVQKLRMSCRIAWFLMLSSSKIEDVSPNCWLPMLSSSKIEDVSQSSFVFKVADRQTARQTDRQTERDR